MNKWVFFLIVVVGLLLRFAFAWRPVFNFDILQYQNDIKIFHQQGNIYRDQQHYNYTPLFYYLLVGIDLSGITKILPFYFVIRAFISIIDLITLFVLLKIAALRHLSLLKVSVFYFLNPALIILSGFHGQFDNLALLFLLTGIYFYETKKKLFLTWVLITIGLITKHIILFPVIGFWVNAVRSRFKALSIVGITSLVFLATFIPYWSSAKHEIVKNVFLYRSVEYRYGFGSMMQYNCGTCMVRTDWLPGNMGLTQVYFFLFMAFFLLFVLLVRFKDTTRGVLAAILYFLTFTNGIGAQYMILPIAFGALFPTKWFILYSAIVTLFLIGTSDELHVVTFTIFNWDMVWIASCLWFISELFIRFPVFHKIYKRLLGE
ncbi:MAG: hypothetical protein M3Q44_00335 [bacterium]|nr:hypothetical protein [bacterium]